VIVGFTTKFLVTGTFPEGTAALALSVTVTDGVKVTGGDVTVPTGLAVQV
jgi:hypothetical protein